MGDTEDNAQTPSADDEEQGADQTAPAESTEGAESTEATGTDCGAASQVRGRSAASQVRGLAE